jgi:glycerate 2-kinase
LLTVYQAAIARVRGVEAVKTYLEHHPLRGRHYLVAIGKAASSMTRGALAVLGENIAAGLVITKRGHADDSLCTHSPVQCLEADHPVPGNDSLRAGAAMLDFIQRTPSDSRLLVLISGGASSLVEVLPPGMNLEDLSELNRALLASGLEIGRMNTVRKAVSMIKGGRLRHYLGARHATTLLISDVPGDDPAVIGSGLLYPNRETEPLANLPAPVERVLEQIKLPLPRIETPPLASITTAVIATLEDAKRAAQKTARVLEYETYLHPQFLGGEAVARGNEIANYLHDAPAGIHIWGGETTVMLPPAPGRGGRNQHLALAAALALRESSGIYLLAAGTDGTDGPTDDAGGMIDGQSIARGNRLGMEATHYLANADAGRFLAATGDLITTGPTGTNVMDLVIALKTEKMRGIGNFDQSGFSARDPS